MPDCPIFLTGFMGSGKSSIARVLSKRLQCRLIDLDSEIVAAAGCSINDIFSSRGEAVFRQMESEQLLKTAKQPGLFLVATGGGAVIADQNRLLMRDHGIIVNLEVSLEQVLKRLSGCKDRPLFAGDTAVETVRGLMDSREQFYADAHIRIDTNGKSVEDVAAEVLCRLKGFQREYSDRKSG